MFFFIKLSVSLEPVTALILRHERVLLLTTLEYHGPHRFWSFRLTEQLQFNQCTISFCYVWRWVTHENDINTLAGLNGQVLNNIIYKEAFSMKVQCNQFSSRSCESLGLRHL